VNSKYSNQIMSTHLSVSNILEQGEKLLGSSISIDAVLTIRGGEAYLVGSTEDTESVQRIPIDCLDLEMKLDQEVGGWMGGPFSYIDPVHIIGKLQVGTVRKNKLVLANVEALALVRDGESINVSFVAGTGVE
jgi:hypothetical protein